MVVISGLSVVPSSLLFPFSTPFQFSLSVLLSFSSPPLSIFFHHLFGSTSPIPYSSCLLLSFPSQFLPLFLSISTLPAFLLPSTTLFTSISSSLYHPSFSVPLPLPLPYFLFSLPIFSLTHLYHLPFSSFLSLPLSSLLLFLHILSFTLFYPPSWLIFPVPPYLYPNSSLPSLFLIFPPLSHTLFLSVPSYPPPLHSLSLSSSLLTPLSCTCRHKGRWG